ncbi:MAG: hypothetical protein AB4352_10600 [Hormoscilla sp.]
MNCQLSYIYIIMLVLQLSSLPDDRGYLLAPCLEWRSILQLLNFDYRPN